MRLHGPQVTSFITKRGPIWPWTHWSNMADRRTTKKRKKVLYYIVQSDCPSSSSFFSFCNEIVIEKCVWIEIACKESCKPFISQITFKQKWTCSKKDCQWEHFVDIQIPVSFLTLNWVFLNLLNCAVSSTSRKDRSKS